MADTFDSLVTDLRKRAVAIVAALDGLPPGDEAARLKAVKANHTSIGYAANTSQKLVDLSARLAAEAAARPKNVGVFVGNAPAEIATIAGLIGRPPEFVLQFCGNKDWGDYLGAGRYQWMLYAAAFPAPGRRVWSVSPFNVDWAAPNASTNGTIEQWAAGAYADKHRALAAEILKYDQSPNVLVRGAHEHNGDWYRWSSAFGKHELYKAGFRSMVAAMRSAPGGERLRFEWNSNVGGEGRMPDPMIAYPGDDVVDTFGMDVYAVKAYDSADPVKHFALCKTRGVGLDWLKRNAEAHGKRIAITEWGVEFAQYGAFVTALAGWMRDNNVIYQNYWLSDSSAKGKSGMVDETAAAYSAAFK